MSELDPHPTHVQLDETGDDDEFRVVICNKDNNVIGDLIVELDGDIALVTSRQFVQAARGLEIHWRWGS